MSDSSPDNSNEIPDEGTVPGTSPDPQLRSFLRQAGAIIAAERGLSDASRAKLQVLATQLELSDETFRRALDQLQSSTEFSTTLNHWEKSFVAFLKKEFKKIEGGILTIRAENRAIDLASRKYQIPEVRAQQLIQNTAQEANVGRISQQDAEFFGNRLIADTIGASSTIDREQLDQLYKIGKKWGLSREAVDVVINLFLSVLTSQIEQTQ